MTGPAPLPQASARLARLRHVSDADPGIRRRRCGRGFRYFDADGQAITDAGTLARIAALAIPPAWKDVWICPHANGHLQAIGRDAKGRKQYRYHPRWQAVRDEAKYGRMILFGQRLARIRARVDADLRRPGLPREKVLAAVVRLLETTLIRVGNAGYARHNRSYGLTTLRDRHVAVNPTAVRFRFRGKGGREHAITLRDRRLARLVKRCRDLPGQELFQYLDDAGQRHRIDSADVNDYLQEIAGEAFTAKDFRTWAGTVLAAWTLRELGAFDNPRQAQGNVVQAIRQVAKRLGNTPAICRRCYVHPLVIDAYLDGSLPAALRQRADEALDDPHALSPQEREVLEFIRRRLAQDHNTKS
ncbi:MAG: DNA topoisomerase IB [Pseudomonadota bacterium]|nr:DNA topoisomerase IB [Pseudomonadota bacterium]